MVIMTSELNLVKTIKAATNGYTVKSTIDVNVQEVLWNSMSEIYEKYGSQKVACLLMNPNTGGIVAMGFQCAIQSE